MTTAPPHRLRVLCVDDNDLVAQAMCRRVEQEGSIFWLGVITDVELIRGKIIELAPDVVLMDIDMPGVDTFSMVQELSAMLPATRIVMFSGHIEASYIEKALDSGAWGYLSKHDDVGSLIQGIRRVGEGSIVFSADVETVRRTLLDGPIASIPYHGGATPSPSRTLKVMVVDDEPKLCASWSRILSAQPDMQLSGTLDRADTLESAVETLRPDVLLMDLSMPGVPPLEAMSRAFRLHPSLRVLIYSGYHDRQTAELVAGAGAHGLVDKLDSPDDILSAMRRVAAGERAFRFPVGPDATC